MCKAGKVQNKATDTPVVLLKNNKGVSFFMTVSAAIQILPKTETTDELIRIVDEVIAFIAASGLSYYVGPFETTVEGDSYDEIMQLVSDCSKIAIQAGCEEVSAYIKTVYKPEGEVLSIDKKVSKHHK